VRRKQSENLDTTMPNDLKGANIISPTKKGGEKGGKTLKIKKRSGSAGWRRRDREEGRKGLHIEREEKKSAPRRPAENKFGHCHEKAKNVGRGFVQSQKGRASKKKGKEEESDIS